MLTQYESRTRLMTMGTETPILYKILVDKIKSSEDQLDPTLDSLTGTAPDGRTR